MTVSLDVCPHCRRYREQLEEVEERLRQTHKAPVVDIPPIAWGLTSCERIIARALADRNICSRDNIIERFEDERADYCAEPKVIDVYICKMRHKLRRFGIDIQTVYGVGYAIAEHQLGAYRAAIAHTGPSVLGPPIQNAARPVLTPLLLAALNERPHTLNELFAAMGHLRPGTTQQTISSILGHMRDRGEVEAVNRRRESGRAVQVWQMVQTVRKGAGQDVAA
jgi:two-component system, cell cycle response regulator CtrA